MYNKSQSREDFCPVCVVGLPMLLAGGSTAAVSSDENKLGKLKKHRPIIVKLSIFMIIIGLSISIYYLVIKPCKQCI